jgi:hypothetical protein
MADTMTTDRLTLARTLEDAGIARDGAEKVASAIFDAIHDNVATKADIAALQSATKADMVAVRGDLAALEQRLERKIDQVEYRLITRLGGLMVVLTGILFAALRFTGHG